MYLGTDTRVPVQKRKRKEEVQGYLAHEKTTPPQDPTAGLCLRPHGGPGGWAFSD
jgi:hypothetical protein